MLEAIKSRTTGTHQPDLSQAPLIALTKEGNSREAPKVLGLLGKGMGKNISKKQNKSASLKKSTGKKQNDSAGKKASKKKATVSKAPQGAAGGDLGKGGKKGTSKKGQGNNWLLSQGLAGPVANPKTPKKPALLTANNPFDLLQEDEAVTEETEGEKASRLADAEKKAKKNKGKKDRRKAREKQRKEAEKEGLASNPNTASNKTDGSLASKIGLTQAQVEAHQQRVLQEIRARKEKTRLSEEDQTDLETGLTWAQICREKEKDSEGFEHWVEENAARQRAGLSLLPLPSEAPTPTPEPQQQAPSTEQQPQNAAAASTDTAPISPPATAIADDPTETVSLPKRYSARLAGEEPEAGGEEEGKKGERGGQKGKAPAKAGTAGKAGKVSGGTNWLLFKHPVSPPRRKGSQPKITDSLPSTCTHVQRAGPGQFRPVLRPALGPGRRRFLDPRRGGGRCQ